MNPVAVVLVLVLAYLLLRPSSSAQPGSGAPAVDPGLVAGSLVDQIHGYTGQDNDLLTRSILTKIHDITYAPGGIPAPAPHHYSGIGEGAGLAYFEDRQPVGFDGKPITDGAPGHSQWETNLGYTPGNSTGVVEGQELCEKWLAEHPGVPCSLMPKQGQGLFADIAQAVILKVAGYISYGAIPAVANASAAADARFNVEDPARRDARRPCAPGDEFTRVECRR